MQRSRARCMLRSSSSLLQPAPSLSSPLLPAASLPPPIAAGRCYQRHRRHVAVAHLPLACRRRFATAVPSASAFPSTSARRRLPWRKHRLRHQGRERWERASQSQGAGPVEGVLRDSSHGRGGGAAAGGAAVGGDGGEGGRGCAPVEGAVAAGDGCGGRRCRGCGGGGGGGRRGGRR